jgi:hypothetical protein
MTTKNNIQYGTRDLLEEDAFNPKKVKVRITTFVDEDVLMMLKNYAKKRGTKYQSVLNALLRSFFEKPAKGTKVHGLSEERVRRIVQEELRKRA